MKLVFILSFFSLSSFVWGQGSFAPPVGQLGTTAIYKDSSVFVGWATNCITNRGPQDIAVPSSPLVTLGDDYMATGKSGENGTVTLGDGGEAILTFDYPIINGIGWDFAVFENSFDGLFLEFAFVEVSSDGINYYRFPSTSEIQETTQTGTFGETDASEVNNLAGKYKAQYGTPFDLNEMIGISGLDIDSVTHVKIIDVIGTLEDGYASFDQFGNKINDPYPTDFSAGGFDLDAVGVIHQDIEAKIEAPNNNSVKIYPTVCSKNIKIQSINSIGQITVFSLDGTIIQQEYCPQSVCEINVENLKTGIYIISTSFGTRQFVKY